MYSWMADIASARDAQERRKRRSFFSVPKKLSTTALSQQCPLRLVLHSMPTDGSHEGIDHDVDDASCKEVDDDGQVEPAFSRPDVLDVEIGRAHV